MSRAVNFEDLRLSFLAFLPTLWTTSVIFLITCCTVWLVGRFLPGVLKSFIKNNLLRLVVVKVINLAISVLGLYLILQILGLTGLAATVLGGTGILGLILGFAFRDISENFLSSILLSIQQPFRIGDLIEVAGFKGFVERMTMRSTLLISFDGNHLQIPNATVFKSPIVNYTANRNLRQDFSVGIGYDTEIGLAQKVALSVLKEHPAVIVDPAPSVLVEELGASTINLRVYFWIDGQQHSQLKVRSSVIRLVKQAFDENEFSMPDEAREVVFPDGVPVQMLQGDTQERESAHRKNNSKTQKPNSLQENHVEEETEDLDSEADEIKKQAEQSERPEQGENLLEESP